MIAFPGMLVSACEAAGIAVPPETSSMAAVEKHSDEFPYFFVFCMTQLCRPIRWGEHWENAHVIASIPREEITSVTLEQLIEKGFEYHTSSFSAMCH